jgi:hypothetical protein
VTVGSLDSNPQGGGLAHDGITTGSMLATLRVSAAHLLVIETLTQPYTVLQMLDNIRNWC